ncbi:MAG: response regulator transcription factor [Clostridia bacterium]|nr:response regulator transcription factor [Clostridia bacterium]
MEGKANYHMNPLPDEITLEDVEIQIDNAEKSHHQYPKSVVEASNKPGFSREHANQSLSEPLTVRELEVLALIAAGLSNQEISDTLFLALSTVKSYNQNIFGKLQVNRRTLAVSKAKELGIV